MAPSLNSRPAQDAASAILQFWFHEAKPYQWYRRDNQFDREIKDRFGSLHSAAAAERLNAWLVQPNSALAFIILLDQFSRNMFRGSARAYAEDPRARNAAHFAIKRRFDFRFPDRERAFFYMPFMHSEALADQDRCVQLFKARMPASGNLSYAIQHRDIIKRFGRFPHRNKVLGRTSTPAEIAYLKAGGFNP